MIVTDNIQLGVAKVVIVGKDKILISEHPDGNGFYAAVVGSSLSARADTDIDAFKALLLKLDK